MPVSAAPVSWPAARTLLGLQFLLNGVAVGDAGGLQDGELFLRSGNAAVDSLQADELRLDVIAQAVDRIVHAVDGDGLNSGHGEVLVLKKSPPPFRAAGKLNRLDLRRARRAE